MANPKRSEIKPLAAKKMPNEMKTLKMPIFPPSEPF